MGYLIGFILFFFIVGLTFRQKGDGIVETISKGVEGCLFWVVIIVVVIIIYYSNHPK